MSVDFANLYYPVYHPVRHTILINSFEFILNQETSFTILFFVLNECDLEENELSLLENF